jgi:uncharacterized protein with PIN domain
MANLTGKQSEIQFCPVCQGRLSNVPREEMVSAGYKSRKTGEVAPETHTYVCNENRQHRFEINQAR